MVVAVVVVPDMRKMQQEPAWPSIVAAHHQCRSLSTSTHACHQDLVYLVSEKILDEEHALAIHDFYSFMLVCLI